MNLPLVVFQQATRIWELLQELGLQPGDRIEATLVVGHTLDLDSPAEPLVEFHGCPGVVEAHGEVLHFSGDSVAEFNPEDLSTVVLPESGMPHPPVEVPCSFVRISGLWELSADGPSEVRLLEVSGLSNAPVSDAHAEAIAVEGAIEDILEREGFNNVDALFAACGVEVSVETAGVV